MKVQENQLDVRFSAVKLRAIRPPRRCCFESSKRRPSQREGDVGKQNVLLTCLPAYLPHHDRAGLALRGAV